MQCISAGGRQPWGIAGLASVLYRRGPEVRLESGTLVDMVLERDITVEHSHPVDPAGPQRVRVAH
jgi:hypothetical protein